MSFIFIQENAYENVVWKMAAILSRPQCVKRHMIAYSLYTGYYIHVCKTTTMIPKLHTGLHYGGNDLGLPDVPAYHSIYGLYHLVLSESRKRYHET